ncbi:hypothetical protein Tco_0412581 [Tanacetum coccineum]
MECLYKEVEDKMFPLDELCEEIGSEAFEVHALKDEEFAQITVLGLCVSFPNGEALSFVFQGLFPIRGKSVCKIRCVIWDLIQTWFFRLSFLEVAQNVKFQQQTHYIQQSMVPQPLVMCHRKICCFDSLNFDNSQSCCKSFFFPRSLMGLGGLILLVALSVKGRSENFLKWCLEQSEGNFAVRLMKCFIGKNGVVTVHFGGQTAVKKVLRTKGVKQFQL